MKKRFAVLFVLALAVYLAVSAVVVLDKDGVQAFCIIGSALGALAGRVTL